MSGESGAAAGLRLAVGTLTMVPVGRLGPTSPTVARWAMLLAPLAALPVALGAGLVAWAGRLVALPPLVTAALAVAAVALGTRMMHLDGLADTADGIGAGWDRERALEVMHRGDVGPMGAVTLMVTLVLQTAALATLVPLTHAWVVVIVVVVVSRAACAVACLRGIPAARQSGLGAVVAGSVPPPATGVTVLLGLAVTAAAARAVGLPGWQGALAAAVGFAGVALLLRVSTRAFGGVTGDVMGASIEVALTGLLVGLAAGSAS